MLKNMKQILRRAIYKSSVELRIPVCSFFRQQSGKAEGFKSVITGLTRILSALHFYVNRFVGVFLKYLKNCLKFEGLLAGFVLLSNKTSARFNFLNCGRKQE
jgi:hypothetical protein